MMLSKPITILCALTLAMLALGSCTQGGGDSQAVLASFDQSPALPEPLELRGTAYESAIEIELPARAAVSDTSIENLYQLSEQLWSGGEPLDAAALEELKGRGINTILSVDGKAPDVETATALGMRYVHVPIRYSEITPDERMKIIKTFREQEGPFFVHCFHGKHRGPAAAALGRMVLDGVSRPQALAEMRQWCGTSRKYEGLYSVVAISELPSDDESQTYEWDFPGRHPFGGFRQAMVEMTRSFDNLELLLMNDWQPLGEHPDLDAFNEADKLAQLFKRSHALPELADKPADFRAWMDSSTEASAGLAAALREAKRSGKVSRPDALATAFERIESDCNACHSIYRN